MARLLRGWLLAFWLLTGFLNAMPAEDSMFVRLADLQQKIQLGKDPDSLFVWAKRGTEWVSETEDAHLLGMAARLHATAHRKDGQREMAMQHGNVAISYFRDAGDTILLASVLNEFGADLIAVGQYYKAEDTLARALELSTFGKDTSELIRAFINLGNAHNYLREDTLALRFYLKARTFSEQQQDSASLSKLLNNLAVVYENLGNLAAAKEAYQSVIAIRKARHQPDKLIGVFANLAGIYLTGKQYGDADSLLLVAEKSAGIHGKANLLPTIWTLQGVSAEETGRLDVARQKYASALDHARRQNDIYQMSYALNNLGHLSLLQGQFQRGLEDLLEALELVSRGGLSGIKVLVLENLGQASIRLGKVDRGIEYFEQGITLRDSLRNIEVADRFAQLQTRYQADKQVLKLEQFRRQQAISDLRINRQRSVIAGLCILLLAGVGISMLWIQRNRLLQKQEIQALQIAQQRENLRLTLDTQEQERSRIARDLHDGIGQFLAAMRMRVGALGKGEAEKVELAEALDQACRDVRQLAHEMMPVALRKTGLKEALEGLLGHSLGDTNLRWELEALGLKKRLPGELETTVFRIVQELINNIIRHAEASTVTIQLTKTGNQLLLVVEDDGKGISSANIESGGLGLENIRFRVAAMEGDFRIEPGPAKGTVVVARFPVISRLESVDI